MKFLKLAFIYKKHDTLRYVKVLYTKSQTLRKKKDNLRYVFIYKIWTLCVTQFFIKFLKLAEGGVFYMEKQFTLRYISIRKNQFTFRYVYIYIKPDTLRYVLICKKNSLCVTFLYINYIV